MRKGRLIPKQSDQPPKKAGAAKIPKRGRASGTAKMASKNPAAATAVEHDVSAPLVSPAVSHVSISATSGGTIGSALSGAGDADVHLSPGVFKQSALSRLFDAGKPGKAVVRPDDLLALRIEFVNLKVAGPPPMLQRASNAAAFVILHFPPQSIAEEVFFETAPAGMDKPDLPDLPQGIQLKPDPPESPVKPPPIRARIAGESRLVFKVPDDFSVPYSLNGVLEACRNMALNVPANALPRGSGTPSISIAQVNLAALKELSPKQRVALSGLVLRRAQLVAHEGANSPTLAAHLATSGALMGQVLTPTKPPVFRFKPKPALPAPNQTAIELPWRLIVAPHASEGFRHSGVAVTSPLTNRTELWHSRLVAPDDKGQVIEPPRPDERLTLRAVWALTGEGSDPNKPMQPDFPNTNELPPTAPATEPFLATLTDFDRFQIAHLSSNFSVNGYTPQPLDTHLLMLSSLGGWLDARGAWDPPGLSVEEWVHRATMGRDHYVRVVYKGFLYPFGHRVALVKVSERKFHNKENYPEAPDGNPAYLRQRMFIVVREHDRSFVDPQLHSKDGLRAFQRQFPFNNVRILTAVTPNLEKPTHEAAVIKWPSYYKMPRSPFDKRPYPNFGQSMFWPCVNGAPFKFRCVGTDIDGRRIQFELPMIFMDNSLASPRKRNGSKLLPLFADETVDGKLVRGAEIYARAATDEWLLRDDSVNGELFPRPRRVAELNRQRVALAPSIKSGDTSVEVETMYFGGEWESQFRQVSGNTQELQALNNDLRIYSQNLARPVFYPNVEKVQCRIAALAQLTGSGASNLLKWNASYLKDGFDPPDVALAAAKNKGQVFADVVPESDMAAMDFSTQGDRAGGFVMPNLKPSGLSRLLGPVTGPVDKYVNGTVLEGTELFPANFSDLPLPLLFGCIPLGEVLQDVAGGSDKLPRFASEASSKLEAFFNTLTRAHSFVQQLGSQSVSLAQAAVDVFRSMVKDLVAQAASMADADVSKVRGALGDVDSKLVALRACFGKLVASQPDGGLPSIEQVAAALAPVASNLTTDINGVITALQNLRDEAGAATLPAGFKQSVLAAETKASLFLDDLKTVPQLVNTGKALYDAVKAVVEEPAVFTTPTVLGPRLDTLRSKIDPLRTTLTGFKLLDGAPRKTVLDVLDEVSEALKDPKIPDNLLGEELVVHFDWNPEIRDWGLVKEPDGSIKPENVLFRANDKHGFIVAVEARMKKNGGSPKVGVICSLKHFDLVLINPNAFLELNFEKIEFSVNSSAKMNVDVLLSDIKFVGPLSFVETLKDLIPLDGFSDPPYLDISTSGIDAGFSMSLPNISVGMFSLTNLSLGAGFTVPFIGQPLSTRFNFCTREQPFNLTVSLFGGGGFFGVTIDPHGVQILEAAFEFGAGISVNFGVASGAVSVMAGIYFRMEKDDASLTGYFRLGGHVRVLGLISASLELYLDLQYEFETGKCVGKAELTIEVSVFMFSTSVKITCERKFSGSNGDPSFRQVMGVHPELPLVDELKLIQDDTLYAWREYCEAFA